MDCQNIFRLSRGILFFWDVFKIFYYITADTADIRKKQAVKKAACFSCKAFSIKGIRHAGFIGGFHDSEKGGAKGRLKDSENTPFSMAAVKD